MNSKVNEDRLITFFEHMSNDLSSSRNQLIPAARRLVRRSKKRAAFVRPELEVLAINNWLACNKHNERIPTLEPRIVSEARRFLESVLWNYASNVNELNIQKTLDLDHLFDLWGFGPGASVGVTGTHTAQKIDQAMVCTDRCEPYVKRLRASNPYFVAHDERSNKDKVTVLGSRLTTVPKNETSVRTIEIQPSGNMVMQLAAGRYLENVLRSIGLDIRHQQPLNKALAKRGSIDGTLCTIDLSNASDTLSIHLLKDLWPSEWVDLFLDLRSPFIEINGINVEPLMVSGMGNGFTFPMMTLTLVALVYANRSSRNYTRSTFIDWSTTAVFGDDIIIPSSEYNSFVEVLTSAGFFVNMKKSFASGQFRESCGGDYLNGVDITPIYVKTLAYDHEIYVAINKLVDWMARHNAYLFSSLRYLFSLLRKGPYFVPFWYAPDSGIRTTRVKPRFKHLANVVETKAYKGDFSMMLACGGYLEDVGFGPFYTPRPIRARKCTKVSRLPKGYLDGREAISIASSVIQSRTDLILSLV